MASAPAASPAAREALLRALLRRQWRLSAACAGTFLGALLGLPLANYLWPAAMATRLFGFPLNWLLLGVLFFPFVWAIAWLFIRRSLALEREELAAARRSLGCEDAHAD